VAQGIGDHIRVFVSARQMRKITRQEAPALGDVSASSRIYPEELAAAAATSAMLFRPNIMEDLETAKCLGGARLIFSKWLGYLEYEKANPVLEWLERHGISLDQCHATGHAGIMELIKLRQAFGTAPVVPIRSRQPGRFDELFGGIERRADGEWWDIAPTRRGGAQERQ
jgi:ribonuclease J